MQRKIIYICDQKAILQYLVKETLDGLKEKRKTKRKEKKEDTQKKNKAFVKSVRFY